MDTGQGVVTGLAFLGQVGPEWGGLIMLGVHGVLLFMVGPLRRFLIVGAMLGVAQFQCD
jgi:hypothetical protein